MPLSYPTIRRGQIARQRVLPEFQRSFGESLPSFTKSAVCWQFCWQLQFGSSQLVDAQASKLEARVGIERCLRWLSASIP
jgi:hypothetical protein